MFYSVLDALIFGFGSRLCGFVNVGLCFDFVVLGIGV